ncbi:Multimodular transpeptidase-transglycosylase [Planococcus halocryophilus Or1]|nr:hypothetical protein [Planococcus halocryophilus]EMF46167.1 Multimodular transpeptidase-transglycosylase [Planococcus halocryophilus Or1]
MSDKQISREERRKAIERQKKNSNKKKRNPLYSCGLNASFWRW